MQNLRPTFLTILCILTFINSAWSIFQGIGNYTSSEVNAGIIQDQFEMIQDRIAEQEGAESMEKIIDAFLSSLTAENLQNNGLATAISSVITLVGAVLMWGLRKRGFYIYLIGTVAGILSPMLIFGGIGGTFMAMGTAFFGILFVILYGLNLKHMS
jgi:hypothetical protein